MPKPVRLRRAILIGAVLGTGILSCLVAENALRIWERPKPDPREAAAIAQGTRSSWEDAQITAADGVALNGWLFTPQRPNGSAVIVLHGVADSREGMGNHARFLLRDGFTVLAPDSRGHGSSGGAMITYGLREADDVHRWADWLLQHRPGERLYGLGASMGGAILLQSLRTEPRFRAVVADSSFASFDEVAQDRLAQVTGLPRVVFWPVVKLGFLYARLRYGLDLGKASPAAAVRDTHVPILLIHGAKDTNIAIRHSQELHALNPATELWEVAGAGHVGSLGTDPTQYRRRVGEWFRSHP